MQIEAVEVRLFPKDEQKTGKEKNEKLVFSDFSEGLYVLFLKGLNPPYRSQDLKEFLQGEKAEKKNGRDLYKTQVNSAQEDLVEPKLVPTFSGRCTIYKSQREYRGVMRKKLIKINPSKGVGIDVPEY